MLKKAINYLRELFINSLEESVPVFNDSTPLSGKDKPIITVVFDNKDNSSRAGVFLPSFLDICKILSEHDEYCGLVKLNSNFIFGNIQEESETAIIKKIDRSNFVVNKIRVQIECSYASHKDILNDIVLCIYRSPMNEIGNNKREFIRLKDFYSENHLQWSIRDLKLNLTITPLTLIYLNLPRDCKLIFKLSGEFNHDSQVLTYFSSNPSF